MYAEKNTDAQLCNDSTYSNQWHLKNTGWEHEVTFAYTLLNDRTAWKPGASDGSNNNLPETYKIHPNYPNPFNPSTTLSYEIPEDVYVSLKVFDVLGREVATLVNEVKKAGSYKVPFEASKLASGVYIYKLRAGSFNTTKKMLLTK